MKKLLFILGGILLSLSASAGGGNTTKCLYVKAIAQPTGAGKVYMHGRLKRGDNPENEPERKCIWDRTGGTGTENVDNGWAGEAYIKAVRGENGSMSGFDCTGTIGRYEFILNNEPEAGYEFVCYSNVLKTEDNAVYTPTECYALIHGEGTLGRRVEDFNYNAPESAYGDLNEDNKGNHFINGNLDSKRQNDPKDDTPENVFNSISKENQGDYFSADPDRTIYAIFRPVGAEYPKFVDDPYQAHFINFPNWGVYAYAWTGTEAEGNVVKLLGDYPGKNVNDMVGAYARLYNNDYYAKTVRFTTAPEYIIFNNGITGNGEEKCGDMTFINGGYYAWDRDGGNISKFVFLETDKAFQIENDTPIQGMSACFPRQFTVNQKSTVCLPFALDANQAAEAGTFYALTTVDGSNVSFEEVTTGIAAYTPYVFVPKKEYPFEKIDVGTLPKSELHDVTLSNGAKMISTLEKTTVSTNDEYTYYGYNTNTGDWVKVVYGGIGTLRPYRACLAVPTSSATAKADVLTATFDDATAIEKVENVEKQSNNAVYDLNGRRVSPSVKGVKIINGKKYINK